MSTIINTVLETIVNVLDFKMNIQQAVDFRFRPRHLDDDAHREGRGLAAMRLRGLPGPRPGTARSWCSKM